MKKYLFIVILSLFSVFNCFSEEYILTVVFSESNNSKNKDFFTKAVQENGFYLKERFIPIILSQPKVKLPEMAYVYDIRVESDNIDKFVRELKETEHFEYVLRDFITTGNANPDINILANVTIRIDKSGTPNKRLKTTAGDFINPTEFKCLINSYFKQSSYSKVLVENGSSLIIENGAKYEVNNNAELVIKSGSSLTIKSGGILTLKDSAQFTVEQGATFTVETGAIIN